MVSLLINMITFMIAKHLVCLHAQPQLAASFITRIISLPNGQEKPSTLLTVNPVQQLEHSVWIKVPVQQLRGFNGKIG
jgi:hypothetical protein